MKNLSTSCESYWIVQLSWKKCLMKLMGSDVDNFTVSKTSFILVHSMIQLHFRQIMQDQPKRFCVLAAALHLKRNFKAFYKAIESKA